MPLTIARLLFFVNRPLYFPEAFINMLALLGWNPGTEQEIFSLEELCEIFTLERVNKSGARFNPEKAKWFNHKYLVEKSNEELAGLMEPLLARDGYTADRERLARICGLLKERANFVEDIYHASKYFFAAPTSYEEKGVRKHWKEGTPALMTELTGVLEGVEPFTAGATEEAVSSAPAATAMVTVSSAEVPTKETSPALTFP